MLLIDLHWPRRFGVKTGRLVEGLLQAGRLMVAAGLVHWWLSVLSASGDFGGRIPELHGLLRNSALVGFTIGFLVPTCYRNNSHLRNLSTTDQEPAFGPLRGAGSGHSL